MDKKNKNILSYQLRKRLRFLGFVLFSASLLISCHTPAKKKIQLDEFSEMIHSGNIRMANLKADSVKKLNILTETELSKLDSVLEIGARIKIDFRLTEADVKNRLAKYYPELNSSMLEKWESSGKLEMRMIDGEKRYFAQAVSNLFRLDDEAKKAKTAVDGVVVDSLDLFCIDHTRKVIELTQKSGEPVVPVKMVLHYTITVKPNVVPEGKIIRCWMPFPRTGNVRQKNIRLISSEPAQVQVAPENQLQRTVYIEKTAQKDVPTIFKLDLELESSAQYFDPDTKQVKPYDKTSREFLENTSERAPQIVFTNQIRQLAKRILQGETNPVLKVQKIYNWINDTIRWASALEFSTFQNIPEYVLRYAHGDCGMQTLLFMTLVRSEGIPAKWQSGWMLHPGEVNLHDWCEVFYEGIGWVPVDQSFGLQKTPDENVRNFYRSGIDSYRLIVNDDFGQKLYPEKKYLRSEPYDFQRGELEWEGGNLYFNQWNWDMEVEYLK